MGEVYDNPKYYEIAFSFRDIPAEVDVFEALIEEHSKIEVSRMLELACGPAPHLEELTSRGYSYVGVDLSRPMLNYAQKKATRVKAQSSFSCASMMDFQLDDPVDFVYILLGSLCARDTHELQSHFETVGRALKFGGLYLLDWCLNFAPTNTRASSWTMTKEDITVRTTCKYEPSDTVEQTVEEMLELEVEEKGSSMELREVSIHRIEPSSRSTTPSRTVGFGFPALG